MNAGYMIQCSAIDPRPSHGGDPIEVLPRGGFSRGRRRPVQSGAGLRLQQQSLRQFVWAPRALAVLQRGASKAHGGMPRRQHQLFRASPRDVLVSWWCRALGLRNLNQDHGATRLVRCPMA